MLRLFLSTFTFIIFFSRSFLFLLSSALFCSKSFPPAQFLWLSGPPRRPELLSWGHRGTRGNLVKMMIVRFSKKSPVNALVSLKNLFLRSSSVLKTIMKAMEIKNWPIGKVDGAKNEVPLWCGAEVAAPWVFQGCCKAMNIIHYMCNRDIHFTSIPCNDIYTIEATSSCKRDLMGAKRENTLQCMSWALTFPEWWREWEIPAFRSSPPEW